MNIQTKAPYDQNENWIILRMKNCENRGIA